MNREEVKRRIEEAGRTALMLPGGQIGPTGYKSCWPDYVRRFEDMVGVLHRNKRTKLMATPRQIDEYDEVEIWLAGLKRHCDRKKIPHVSRAVGYGMLRRPSGRRVYSWRKVAKKLHCNHKTARVWYESGIDIITKQLTNN